MYMYIGIEPIVDCEIDDEFTKPDFSSKKI